MLSDIIKTDLNPTTQNWIDLYILDMRIFLGVGYKGGHLGLGELELNFIDFKEDSRLEAC